MADRRHNFILQALRRASLRWWARNEAKVAARVERGVYRCAGYKRRSHKVRAKETQLDHIVPIGKFENWDTYIERLLPEPDGWQVLCKECHLAKTKDEK